MRKERILVKPKCDQKGHLINPAEIEAHRRYKAVTKSMHLHGISEAEAIALYDRPRGVCQVKVAGVVCGAPCHSLGRRCAACTAIAHAATMRRNRADQKHFVDKICGRCEKPFHGHPLRVLCEACAGRHMPTAREPQELADTRRARARRRPPPPPKVPQQHLLPATWERPLSPARLAPPSKPKPVVRPPHVKVRFLAPVVPEGFRR